MTWANGFRLERVFTLLISLLTALSVLGLCGAAYSSSDAPVARQGTPTKKVLLYGTDAPTPAEARGQAVRLDRSAFDATPATSDKNDSRSASAPSAVIGPTRYSPTTGSPA